MLQKRSKNNTPEEEFNGQSLHLSEGDVPTSQYNECCCEQGSQHLLMATEFLNKTQDLRYVLETDLLACDAKWTLFVATALSYRYESKLIPFPPRFAQEQAGCHIDALVSVINDTPKLIVVLQTIVDRNFEEIDTEVIELLYWVLIVMREPYLRLVDGEEVSTLLKTVDEKEILHKPTYVFELNAPEGSHSDVEFRDRFSDLPVKLAFCGQTLDSYYAIIHNGFSANKTEEPMMLSTDLLTSLRKSPSGAAWGASQCGSLISCTALCEFAYDTAVDKITPNRKGKSCVDIELNDVNKMRIRYLLFYGSRFPYECKPHKRGVIAWISHHKYGLSLVTYLMILASIAVANSGSGHTIRVYIGHKIQSVLEFCKKMLVTE